MERDQVFPLFYGSYRAFLLGWMLEILGVCLIMCRRGNTCRGSAYSSAGFHPCLLCPIHSLKKKIAAFLSLPLVLE